MHRAIDSHRWNGRKNAGKSNNNRCFPDKETGDPNLGDSLMSERTLVVYRVSRKDSTTKNQKFALDEFVKSLPIAPQTLDIQGSNWRRPIPEMENLMKEVKAGKWDMIVLWRTDRIGRRPLFDLQLWEECRKVGCVLWLLEPDLRSDRDEDEVAYAEQSVAGRKEQKLISTRVRTATARIREEVANGTAKWKWVGRKGGAHGRKVMEKMKTIVTALKGGASIRQLMKELGFAQKTLQRIRDENGIPPIP